MNVSRMQASAWALAGLLAGTANANVLVDNFEEGSVDSQAGPYSDYQGHWVESIETGLPPADVIGGARRTSVYGWMSDWQSAHLTGGAMRFHLDEDLLYDAGLRYESLGGLALHGSGIALDVNYDLTGGRDTAVFLRLALSDTHGGSGTIDLVAGHGHDQVAFSGAYEFGFDDQIRRQVDFTSIDGIELSLMSNYVTRDFAIDNIRETPEPGMLAMLALAGAGLLWRRSARPLRKDEGLRTADP